MERLDLHVDPRANDPGNLGVSLVNVAEILVPCLEAAGARSVVEVGAYAGDLTGLLLEWAASSGARIVAIDPSPQPELERLATERSDLELLRETSLEALARLEPADAVVIDGDHNWHTVSEELRIIAERAGDGSLPLLLFHDVCWPHGRRDDYFDPDLIPEDRRQPVQAGGMVFPGEPGIASLGIRYRWPAAREGGPRNGVLTAVEDFVAAREGLNLAVVPAFFGFGVVWDAAAPWAEDIAQIVAPWHDNPMVSRLEANRVRHLATAHGRRLQLQDLVDREARRDEFLRRLLQSRAFELAERISRVRQRGRAAFSREDVRRALEG